MSEDRSQRIKRYYTILCCLVVAMVSSWLMLHFFGFFQKFDFPLGPILLVADSLVIFIIGVVLYKKMVVQA